MNIQEQILAGLQQKFAGVDTAILSKIAAKKAVGLTDESKVNSIIEGIAFKDVLTYYGDFRAGEASVTAVSNYEKKYGLKEGKAIEQPNPQEQTKPVETGDIAAQIAKAIGDAIKPISDRLDQFDSTRKHETRLANIMAKAKEYDIPELIAKRFAGDIKDDEDLDKYFQERKQELVNIGLAGSNPPDDSERRIEKENETIAKMINDKTNEMIGNK